MATRFVRIRKVSSRLIRRLIHAAVLAVAGTSCAAAASRSEHAMVAVTADTSADRAIILSFYADIRRAHFARDPSALVASESDSLLNVTDGMVQVRSREAHRIALAGYLADRRFREIVELEPPRIEIAADGKHAWLIGHVRIRGTDRDHQTQADHPFAFAASWIDLWLKTDGK
jgi:ketosteroid isomerase-like protein